MFTGIVQALGRVEQIIENASGDKKFLIEASRLNLEALGIGDSICCSGVCLTATEYTDSGFWADVSSETLGCTSFNNLVVGSRLNLECSLTPTTSLGGHLVSGHVDGLGEVVAMERDAESWRVRFLVPETLARYIASKGSICIDGTSLTVNEVEGREFGVNIIPHTFENTVFSTYEVGTAVNIEVDLIARYVERLLSFKAD